MKFFSITTVVNYDYNYCVNYYYILCIYKTNVVT